MSGRDGQPVVNRSGESEPPVPDLPDELFPSAVRPVVFRILWAVALLLVAGLGVVAWRYLTVAGW